ncbi:unnamed protein product [Tuber melanosporum]|uniref:(Perigord truffle) hypothetical protein n=1 Tax=Tuber melanosporum (strain Mel28) TaxID=656061 RepID=D5G602_TUBMM|nr:uncharacterized protein GSTUM_00001702001 [Tuber melanosporum]CAZ79945.1 unnamed protein product [Tuber melanosporum]
MGYRSSVPLLLFLFHGTSSSYGARAGSSPAARSLGRRIGCGAAAYPTPHSCRRASPLRAAKIDERHCRRSCRGPGRHLCSPSLLSFPPSFACASIGWGDSLE